MGTESLKLWILLVFTQLTASLVADHLSYARLESLKFILSHYRWEQEGIRYQHIFHIKLWKDLVPELGNHFDKNHLKEKNPAYLMQFILESVRAETCHLLSLLFALPLLRQAPLWVIIYIVLINIPCIIIQRYNRPRLEKLMQQMLKKQNGKISTQELPVPVYGKTT